MKKLLGILRTKWKNELLKEQWKLGSQKYRKKSKKYSNLKPINDSIPLDYNIDINIDINMDMEQIDSRIPDSSSRKDNKEEDIDIIESCEEIC